MPDGCEELCEVAKCISMQPMLLQMYYNLNELQSVLACGLTGMGLIVTAERLLLGALQVPLLRVCTQEY